MHIFAILSVLFTIIRYYMIFLTLIVRLQQQITWRCILAGKYTDNQNWQDESTKKFLHNVSSAYLPPSIMASSKA